MKFASGYSVFLRPIPSNTDMTDVADSVSTAAVASTPSALALVLSTKTANRKTASTNSTVSAGLLNFSNFTMLFSFVLLSPKNPY